MSIWILAALPAVVCYQERGSRPYAGRRRDTTEDIESLRGYPAGEQRAEGYSRGREKHPTRALLFCQDKQGGLSIPFLEEQTATHPRMLFAYLPGRAPPGLSLHIDSRTTAPLRMPNVVFSDPLPRSSASTLYEEVSGLGEHSKIISVHIATKPSIPSGAAS